MEELADSQPFLRGFPVLARLGSLISESPKHVRTFGGGHMNFTPKYDWDWVVLEPSTTSWSEMIFKRLFQREQWFREHRLPIPAPGSCTALRATNSRVIKVMASRPAMAQPALDFCHEYLTNESLTGFFETAAQNAPSLMIFEDLDRAFVPVIQRLQSAEDYPATLPELS